MIMIDLDHFKTLNDMYGHAAGDEALRSVTRAFGLREIDTLARWGGEEFVALMPGIDEKAASIVAEKLRCAVADARVEVGAETIAVTASFGVAQVWRWLAPSSLDLF